MASSAKLSLPPNVQVRLVATVAGLCMGRKANLVEVDKAGSYVEADGVTVTLCGVVGLADINIPSPDPAVWDEPTLLVYHFESDPDGRRIVTAPSEARYLALFTKLVNFFGGRLDYDDCDRVECDLEMMDRTNRANAPVSDVDYAILQERLLAIEPVEAKDIPQYIPNAGCKC